MLLITQIISTLLMNYTKFENLRIPLYRSNQGLNNNMEYINSALKQIEDLKSYHLISSDTTLLDFGCGQGSLVNGLLYSKFNIKEYQGIDTDLKSIKWCQDNLSRNSQGYNFIEVSSYVHINLT